MLNNKWIIVNKEEPVDNVGLFVYTLVMVDSNISKKVDMRKQMFSKKHFKIGSFIDDNLNSLSEQYSEPNTDIAIVQSTKLITPIQKDKTNYRVSFFNGDFGDFDIIMSPNKIPFSMKRRDTILVCNEKKQDLTIRFVKNITTGEKSIFYNDKKNRNKHFTKVIVLATDKCNQKTDSVQKHLLTYSKKFGYTSFIVSTQDIEYSARIGDKLLLEQKLTKQTQNFEILRNLTIDTMRSQFLNR